VVLNVQSNVQPDNFLVSSSGHLKIADFGLATSGEWIYQESYRSSRRRDLLRKYHKSIISDGAEEALASRPKTPKEAGTQTPGMGFLDQHEKWKKMHADSVVGTYYYMAPEVLQGESYNATADWYTSQPQLPRCLISANFVPQVVSRNYPL
jgi:serine/threonine protein kinase